MEQYILEQLSQITTEEQEILDGRTQIDASIYHSNSSKIIDSNLLLSKGKLIEIRPHTRFIHFPKHTHNYIEMVYMCKGSTTHFIDGEKIELKEGELLFLSKEASQEILPAAKDDIAINFIILPEFFDLTLTMLGNDHSYIHDFLIDALRSRQSKVHYLHFKVSDILPVQNLVENLVWILLNHPSHRQSLSKTTMGLLFQNLISYSERISIGENRYEQELLLQVYRFIENRYKNGELSELATTLNCELSFLSRLIKSHTGKTYTELIQQKRLSQATYLLTNTSLSITDISLAIGYNNFSYFYRIFQQVYHMSPRAYRMKAIDL